MKISVLHDQRGEIVAVSNVGDLQAAGSKFTKVGMLPGKGQHLLEIELAGEHERKPLREIHNEYRVDVISQVLVKKT